MRVLFFGVLVVLDLLLFHVVHEKYVGWKRWGSVLGLSIVVLLLFYGLIGVLKNMGYDIDILKNDLKNFFLSEFWAVLGYILVLSFLSFFEFVLKKSGISLIGEDKQDLFSKVIRGFVLLSLCIIQYNLIFKNLMERD
jgi:hypothetical protein